MKIRSFIAVELPESLREGLHRFIQELKPKTDGVRWLDPNGIHLTLRFLGSVKEEVIDEVKARLKPVAASFAPFRLKTEGVGCFPNRSRPRVVWVGLAGEVEILSKLKNDVFRVVEGLDVKPEEERIFHPHLTVGRIRDPRRVSGMAEILEMEKKIDIPEFSIDKLILFKSDLKPTGATYTPLEVFSLT